MSKNDNYIQVLNYFNGDDENSIKFRNNINKDDNWIAIAKNYLTYMKDNINKISNLLDIINAIYKCASYDLFLDGQEAYLMINFDKNSNTTKCKLGLMTSGMIKKLYKSDIVKFIHIDIVYDEEDFEYFLSHDGYNFKHKPDYKLRHNLSEFDEDGVEKKNYIYNKMLLAYVRYVLNDGTVKIHVCDKNYILKCKKTSKMPNIWNSWPEQMIKKTVIRNSIKELPQLGDIFDDTDEYGDLQSEIKVKSNVDNLMEL
jgi:recombinational DNA repair protein RecT